VTERHAGGWLLVAVTRLASDAGARVEGDNVAVVVDEQHLGGQRLPHLVTLALAVDRGPVVDHDEIERPAEARDVLVAKLWVVLVGR